MDPHIQGLFMGIDTVTQQDELITALPAAAAGLEAGGAKNKVQAHGWAVMTTSQALISACCSGRRMGITLRVGSV